MLAALAISTGVESGEAGETDVPGDAWSDPRNPIVQIFGGERLDLWSLRPVPIERLDAMVPVAESGAAAWTRNAIDAFVLAKLESAGLTPAPEADRRTLIRRLTFGLTGLPPTADEVEHFLADDAPGAYERLVDRLLDSPHYGEHWGRMWLDVVRYSDSNGFDWDEFRKEAWRFRDYVIRSLNADKPFDRFVIEQLAGDELVDGAPRTEEERDCLIATGYLRLGPHDNSAALFNEQPRGRAELMFDLVETTGSAFLGLTLSCCRCHDHKFDPLSQADYFRMRGFFEGVAFADDVPVDLAERQDEIRRDREDVERVVAEAVAERDALLAEVSERLREERRAALSEAERAILESTDDEAASADVEARKAIEARLEVTDEEVLKELDAETRTRHEEIGQRIEELEASKPAFAHGLLMTDVEGEPPATFILEQGDYRHETVSVPPGFPTVFGAAEAELIRGTNPRTTGRRLTLARWIASPENPLTARVLVNRVWQGHFGQGLVATPNDFGLAGTPPSHPELLDWLAGVFVRDGWSLKSLHRRIVTSAAYRQTGSVDDASWQAGMRTDPANTLLWRQNPRRLSAEQLRDALLHVAGRLQAAADSVTDSSASAASRTPGGPPIWPELPPEVLQANPAFLDDNETRTKGWYPSPPDRRDVRSVYLVQKRTVRIPFLETFDLPENSTSCGRRTESVVAPQALSLLNGPMAVDAARAFARRIEESAASPSASGSGDRPGAAAEPDVDALVRAAFRLALQRLPAEDEAAACRALLERRSLAELARVLLNTNEFVYVD